MALYVPDTHCLIWQATAAPQLGTQATAILAQVDQGNAELIIPAMVVAELLFTIERRKLPINFPSFYSDGKQTQPLPSSH